MPGKAWVTHEWLAEILYASAYNFAGHAGLAAIVALALMAATAILFFYLRSRVGPVAMLAGFVSFYLALQPFFLARPHVIAWSLLAGWTAVLLNARDTSKAPPWALLALMLVWANTHASFFVGFLVAAAIGFDDCVAQRWSVERVVRWVLFGAATLAASLLTPSGLQGLIYPLTVSNMASLPSIVEWQASTPQFSPYFYVVFIAGLAAVLVARPRFQVGELALLLLTLAMAFTHLRHQAVFVILAILIVTPKLGGSARELAPALFHSGTERRIWIAGAAIAVLAVAGVRASIPLTPKETYSNPRALIAQIPASVRTQPVFNEYSLGGPLILAGIRPYIDGRADMYGDAFTADYLKIVAGDRPAFERAVRRYGISWTVLQRGDGLVRLLDSSPGWQRIYSDRVGVIHVRRDSADRVPPLGDKKSEHQDRH